MVSRGHKVLAISVVALVCLQAALAIASFPTVAEDRLPAGYLLVFNDDFQSGVLDSTKWEHWTGDWSTDDVGRTQTGGIFPGDNYYLTESPYPDGFGHPLDDNGNEGIYWPDENALIETTWIDLRNITSPRLEFKHMYDIPSYGDGAMVFARAFTDERWELLQPDSGFPEGSPTGWTGKVLTWDSVLLRLEDFEGERIKLAFYFKSAPDGIEGDGWMIDDVQVGGRPQGTLPDLKVGNARMYVAGYPVTTAQAGDVVEFNASILNEGHARADPFMVSVYTAHPLAGGELIGEVLALEGLPVGSSIYAIMRWTAEQGPWKPLIFVDPLNRVPEENELNNVRELQLDVDEPGSGDVGIASMHFEEAGQAVLGVGVGDLVTISVTLRNYGREPVTTPMVLQAYDGDPSAGGQPIGDEKPQINAIEPGRDRRFDIHWRPLAGNYSVFVVLKAVQAGQAIDENPANEIAYAMLEVTDSPPINLVVEELDFIVRGSVGTSAFAGDNVGILATVSNEGESPYTGSVDVAVFDGDPDSGGVEVARRAVVGVLGPGESAHVEMDWRGELGTHALTAFVDPGNRVFESNEDDNQLTGPIIITRAPYPDLVIADMMLLLNGEPIDLTVGTNEGAQVEVNVTVQNMGNDRTRSPTVAQLYLGNPLLGGKPLGSFTVPEGLNPDEVFIKSIMWPATRPAIKDRVQVLFVMADALDKEREQGEFNNLDQRPVKVGEPLPDLKVSSVRVLNEDGTPATSITYGLTVTLEVGIRNTGTDVCFQSAGIEVYVDSTEPIDLIATEAAPTLDINESITKRMSWTPDPNKVGGGEHTIIVLVDPTKEIRESSDANNEGTTTLVIDANARPNLLVASIEVRQGDRVVDRVTRGDKVQVRLQVLNLGEAPLFSAATVELFQGQVGVGPTQEWTIKALPVGGNWTETAEWEFGSDEPLTVQLDRANRVRETSEADNLVTLEVEVVPPEEGANGLAIGALLGVGILVLILFSWLVTRPRRAAPEVAAAAEGAPVAPVPEVAPGPQVMVDVPVEDAVAGEAITAPEVAAAPEAAAGPEVTAPAETPAAPPLAEAPAPTPPPEPEAAPAAEPAPTAEPVPATKPTPTTEPVPAAEAQEAATPAEAPKCPQCGEVVDPGWILCPYCEASLK